MNCKPGDLAYIVVDPLNPNNLGKVVQVAHVASAWVDPDVHEWTCVPCGEVAGFDTSRGNKPVCAKGGMLIDIPDAWLRPISGVPLHDEQHDEAKEPA